MPEEPNVVLARLRGTHSSLAERASYALELLKKEKRSQLVQVAIQILADYPVLATRERLLSVYEYWDKDGPKRDPGGYIRSAALKVLQVHARLDDIPLLLHAVSTYEFLPPSFAEEGALIRSTALVVLNDLDETLAGYHAVRLLTDQYTSMMSGEPALTAVRVLADQNQSLPLFYYVTQEGGRASEVVAECLRSLTGIPDAILPILVEKYRESVDDGALVGLFDLLLGHSLWAEYLDFILDFVQFTQRYDVYQYLVIAIATSRKKELISGLLNVAQHERDKPKIGSLIEALTFVPGDKNAEALLSRLRAHKKTPLHIGEEFG